MCFVASDVSHQLVRQLREPLAALRRHDADLAKQAMRALTSVPLNIAEGSGRSGADRRYHYRVALGSLRELGAALEVAVALGYLAEAPCAAERDRLGGLIYGLQRG